MRPLETLYDQTRRRVIGLVEEPGDEAIEVAGMAVPACPAWSVHDVVAHVTGICADVLAGNIAGAATDEWTAAQVEVRRDASLADIVAEWHEVGPKVAAMIDDFPEPYDRQVVADLAIHEHDIRGSLGRPGARESDALWLGLDFLASAVAQPGAGELGIGPLEMRSGTRSWTLGNGAAGGDEGSAPPGTLTADPFELFRALTGRRSAAQIRSLDWSVDPDPYLALFGLGPFQVRAASLVE